MILNPCDAVVLPPKVKYEPRFLTEQEQKIFLETAEGYSHCDICCENLSCGARIGELLGLKWSDIDFENKTIHIQRTLHYGTVEEGQPCHFFFTTPKTETSTRKIPLLPETEEILKRVQRKQLMNRKLHASHWQQSSPFEDMVFTSQFGAPVRYGDVNRTIKMAVVRAYITKRMPKWLRKRFEVEMMNAPECRTTN